MMLGQKYGELVGMLLSAYETGDEVEKSRAIREFQHELRVWYEAQPVEDRREYARHRRRFTDYFSQMAELARSEFNAVTQSDVP